jgi:hypothetical protein
LAIDDGAPRNIPANRATHRTLIFFMPSPQMPTNEHNRSNREDARGPQRRKAGLTSHKESCDAKKLACAFFDPRRITTHTTTVLRYKMHNSLTIRAYLPAERSYKYWQPASCRRELGRAAAMIVTGKRECRR